MQAFTARLPDDLYEWLRTESFKTRKSQNSIIIEALASQRDRKASSPEKVETQA